MPLRDARLLLGDCLTVLPTLDENSVDAVCCDPPYALTGANGKGGFMGSKWDSELPTVEHWRQVLRVLKPGGYMLSFGGSRTYHRLACAVEDAGFEIRDCLMWLYGQGFPKGKGNLKPAYEPILLCRKPGPRVLSLGIDECRVGVNGGTCRSHQEPYGEGGRMDQGGSQPWRTGHEVLPIQAGRWPANVCHSGEPEVMETFARFGNKGGGYGTRGGRGNGVTFGQDGSLQREDHLGLQVGYGDEGSPARFFACCPADTEDAPTSEDELRFMYCSKASKSDRGEGNSHPTTKPTKLMEWLIKLVCPVGGLVLDPFLGSGTTCVAAIRTSRRCVGIEREASYMEIAKGRVARARQERDSKVEEAV